MRSNGAPNAPIHRSCTLAFAFAVVASISTNTGVAPVYTIASAVATKVFAVVMTSSPSPIPAVKSPRRWSRNERNAVLDLVAFRERLLERSTSSPRMKAAFWKTRSSDCRFRCARGRTTPLVEVKHRYTCCYHRHSGV
jgi:hypothetical protein